ncbi:MAG TPA: FG-GAP-like repeat-containing protein, partial [Phycisphaerae bacterium]|nr:FG-GAP-like repeat-containing protein [Phycisphaerae bacterium]
MRRGLIVVLLMAVFCPSPTRTVRADDAEFVRRMNRGKAYFENRDSAKAVEEFKAAIEHRRESAAAWRNLGRAQLLADRMDEAISALREAEKRDADSAASAYVLGLAYSHKSEFETSVPEFERAARLDAHTPEVRFQLALAYQAAGQDDKALTQFKETVRLDPLNAAAWFKLAAYARQAGDQLEAQRCQREFMRLRKLLGDQARNAQTLETCIHTKAEASALTPTSGPTTQAAAIEVRFVEATSKAFGDDPPKFFGVAVLDVDESGRPRLIGVRGDGAVCTLIMDEKGRFQISEAGVRLEKVEWPVKCIVGDFHNPIPSGEKYDAKKHARNDCLILNEGRAHWLRHTAAGQFEDVSATTGFAKLHISEAVWADADHDGDLDLLTVTAKKGLSLLQNNGNGTFKDVSREVNLPEVHGGRSLFAIDLDGNDAVDFIIGRGDQPTLVIENRRAGQFRLMPEPPGPWPAAFQVLADDLNNDGRPDVILFGPETTEILYGATSEREMLRHGWEDAKCAALADIDNSGFLDLVVGHESKRRHTRRIEVWRIHSDLHWKYWIESNDTEINYDSSFIPGLAIDSVSAGDFDADGDSDLLVRFSDNALRYFGNES